MIPRSPPLTYSSPIASTPDSISRLNGPAFMGADQIIIAGGGEIYAQTIKRASRLFITEVALDAEGDVRFPPIDPAQWREASRERGERGARDEADFAFVEYERRE